MFNVKKKKAGNVRVFQLSVSKYIYAMAILCLMIVIFIYVKSRYVVPMERVTETSTLIMLGDLNDDGVWDANDQKVLDLIIAVPWDFADNILMKVDVNSNQFIDAEDIAVLSKLYSVSNPYLLQDEINPAPKAREFYRYAAVTQYVQRPLYGLKHNILNDGPVGFLSEIRLATFNSYYLTQLAHEIYDEALRFSFIYEKRHSQLSRDESDFVRNQLVIIADLFEKKNYYDLLLHLILLSEAGETLTTHNQTEFIKNLRFLTNDLRQVLSSPRYSAFQVGDLSWESIFQDLDAIKKNRVGFDTPLHALEPARNLTDLRNYIDRAEWQYYKSKNIDNDFHSLVLFAQTDRRYLRAVSNTSPKHQDMSLQNHNLPMMLLFSQAMAISDNDKKLAVGLLDETIRIPFFWVKALPDEIRPNSVALENFLLPGNMEDGSDKSRHWNVFGGLSLYRSPEKSLTLAFQREVEDVRKANYAPEAMTEFIRDMIANCNGIYHIVSYNKQ
ncbi:MAG: hypothetical protein ACJAT7_001725 [Psychromonas sp.]|jgi:hypothetical protein|uniref:hypothetical protein n=1 Tax=Psychromonas sp. TaxID=1884585 RepID=UPI0039E2781E